MMPAAKHGDPQLGIDIHMCSTPVPTPLPTPHLSVVFDPFDYIPILGATVTVCGMKRATAGTAGIAVHIPPGFPFAPMLPQKDDELFMGSSTVTVDGEPMSYLALPVLSCQVAGMMSPPRLKKKGPKRMALAPLVFNLAIPSNVFVGGPPTISLMGLAMKGAFAALGKFAKSGVFKRMRQKLFKNINPGFLKCKILRAEPVNILTGAVSIEHEDFVLSGRIAFQWGRVYGSDNQHVGHCGHGWETPADGRLEINQDNVLMHYPGAGPLCFSRLPLAAGDAATELELQDGAVLMDASSEYRIRTKADRVYHFPKSWIAHTANGGSTIALSEISDLCGNWLRFERRKGVLTAIQESAGRRLEFVTDQGRILEIALVAAGIADPYVYVRYEYNEHGNLVTVRDALDHPYTFGYDMHHMVSHTDRNGLSFYYQYDRSDETWRVVHAWGENGLYDYQFTYWPVIRERRIKDSLGNVHIVQCNEWDLPILEIDPLGGRTLFEYDDAGRTTAVVDPANRRTEYCYDANGNLLVLTRPDKSTIQVEFNADNKPIRITDPGGNTWVRMWDARGLMIEQRSPLGAITKYEYSISGLLISVTDANGSKTNFSYNVNGHLASRVDALGHVWFWQRDAFGNVLATTNPLGRTKVYLYDPKNRLVEVRLPRGTTIHYEHDTEDRLSCFIDENGMQTRFEYFGQGMVSKRHQPNGHVIQYHFDTEEQLIGVTNQRGETYQLRRDALGRVIEKVDYWGQSTTFQFDASGHLQQRRDPLGSVTYFKTDELGRICSKRFAHPLIAGRMFEETFEYDVNGNLVACTNEHVGVQRRFDAEGRLLEEQQGDFVVRNTFDVLGRRIKRETSACNCAEFEHDKLGRPMAIRVNNESISTVDRNSTGHVLSESLGHLLVRCHSYDLDGRPTAQHLMRRDERLFAVQYEYDAVGNLTRRSDDQYGVNSYQYDPLGQIVECRGRNGTIQRFAHDPAGDRLLTRVVEHAAQSISGHGQIPDAWSREGIYEDTYYRFDRAGNLIERSDTSRIHGDGREERTTTSLTWDANQRLVRSQTNGVETIYRYDALGRRVLKQTGSKRTRFGWDGHALLAESLEDSSAQPAESASSWRSAIEYLYYPGTFTPLGLLEEHTCRYYYHTDPNGYPTRLTRRDGETAWAASYEIWGSVGLLINDVKNPLRFQGQYEDGETSLHYNRFRYFDPVAGIFVSQDPIGLSAGESLYAYACNALTWIDPLGLTCSTGRGLSSQGVPIYRGTSFYTELLVADETGLVLSDAARIAFLEARLTGVGMDAALDAARLASERAHANQLRVWGSLDDYVRAHGEFGAEITEFGPRSLISWTTDESVAMRFAGPDGRVFSATVPGSLLIPQNIEGATEAEVLIPHAVRLG